MVVTAGGGMGGGGGGVGGGGSNRGVTGGLTLHRVNEFITLNSLKHGC